LTMRIVVKNPSSYGSYIIAQEVDCAGQTKTLVAAQGFDVDGKLYRAVTFAPDEREAEPIFAGSGDALLYRRVCPRGRVLPQPEPAGPPPVVVPQGVEADPNCNCAGRR
jgi:hypothetical protein